MKLAFCASLFLLSLNASAQYWKTLPKGVRTFVFRNVQTSEITSTYNHSRSVTPYAYEIEASAKNLEGIENPEIQAALDLIRPYQDVYNSLSAGTYKISADADVSVNAYGMGYGITDTVTAYAFLPMFHAKVNMKYKRTAKNNYEHSAELLQTETGNDGAQGYGNIIQALPDLDGPTLQSLIVNNFGYEEIGDWEGEGPGDMEFGIMYNFLNEDTHGLMLTLGGVAPTGMRDNPDILQDVPFGDGQWDGFFELGGGYQFSDKITLNSWARYTRQFAAEKELRVPYDEDVDISDETATFTEKLGDKLLFDLDLEYFYSDWVHFQTAYLYEQTGKAKYISPREEANGYLAKDTDSSSHSMRLMAGLSSVNSFMKKEFLLPAQFRVYYQTMLQGRNTPKVDRVELEFRMFF